MNRIYNKIVSSRSIIVAKYIVRYISDDMLLKKLQKSQIKRISLMDPRADQLINCVRKKDYTKLEKLIKSGLSIDSHNKNENTPLTDAAKRGDLQDVKKLLELGANPYASCDCPMHNTAMHYAAMNGHEHIIKYMLEIGINPNVSNSMGELPKNISSDEKCKKLFEIYKNKSDKTSK